MVRPDTIGLFVALILSVVLHAVVLPMVYLDSPSMTHSPPAKSTHLETPSIEDEEVDLGIDKSNESTLTWIGYNEYEEQRAQFSKVEQAAMTTEVQIAQPIPSTEVAQPMPPNQVFNELVKPMVQLAQQLLSALQNMQITLPARDIPSAEQDVIEPVEVVRATDIPTPQQDVRGEPSDRDSEATSVIQISPDKWKSGKPLAAEGIVLRPRKPSFTANQMVSNAPGGLVADLFINRQGKPMQVEIIVSTGNPSIDRSLESSLYRWRASGDRIDALNDEETVRITIHIMFH